MATTIGKAAMLSLAWRCFSLCVAAAGIYCGSVAFLAFRMGGIAQSSAGPGTLPTATSEPSILVAEGSWAAASRSWRLMGLEGRAELDRARGALLRTPTSSEQWAARKAMLSAALTRNPTASFLWAELARADLADREPPDADGGRHAYAALRMAQVTAPREPVHTLARALLLLRHWQKLGSVTTAETKAAFTDLLLQDVANGWKYYTPFERQLLRASFELLPDRDIATMRVPLAARIGPAGPGQ